MGQHLDHLDSAKAALLAGDPSRCTAEIQAFEDLCLAEPPVGGELALCNRRLQSLRALTDASIEGVSAACAELREAVAAAGHLVTYDSAGARESRATRPALTRRY